MMKAAAPKRKLRLRPQDVAIDLKELAILRTKSPKALRAIAEIKAVFGKDARVVM